MGELESKESWERCRRDLGELESLASWEKWRTMREVGDVVELERDVKPESWERQRAGDLLFLSVLCVAGGITIQEVFYLEWIHNRLRFQINHKKNDC